MPPGSDAVTIWSVISVRRESAGSAHLLRHEEEHVRQWRKLGPARFVRQYLGAYLAGRWYGFGHRAAYRMIPLEIEAEDAARRFMERRTCGLSGDPGGSGGDGSLS